MLSYNIFIFHAHSLLNFILKSWYKDNVMWLDKYFWLNFELIVSKCHSKYFKLQKKKSEEWVQWGTNLLHSHWQFVPIQPLAPAVTLQESSPNLTFRQWPCVPLVCFEAWPLTWLIQIAYQLSMKFILPLLGEIWFLVIIYFCEITISKIFIGKQHVS